MFENGVDFAEIFDIPEGSVRVFADTHVLDQHLILDEVLFYPEFGEKLIIGVPQVLAICRLIRNLALEEGFESLTIVYHRVRRGRIGRTMSHTWRLR